MELKKKHHLLVTKNSRTSPHTLHFSCAILSSQSRVTVLAKSNLFFYNDHPILLCSEDSSQHAAWTFLLEVEGILWS